MQRRDPRSPKKYLNRKTVRKAPKTPQKQIKEKDKENIPKKHRKGSIKCIKSKRENIIDIKSNETVKKVKIYSDIPLCNTFHATEEDLQNPIAFFESLWEKSKPSSGIIKVIPPKSWQQENKNTFDEFYFKHFEQSNTKLEIRSQRLNRLHLAKVSLLLFYPIYKNISFLVFLDLSKFFIFKF